ncbi:type II toxin-antitoxin system VapC family toxin [Candidatus Micrarchaeota archaeon]|nr:type II toxin-antitoxin system VapC family toxin [Candidatus Micrarchaeota archaeon]
MVCLDTDLLIGFMRRKPDAVAFLQQLEKSGEPLMTTIISACELFEGAFSVDDSPHAQDEVMAVLDRLTVLPLGLDSSRQFGFLSSSLAGSGKMLEDFDVLIAAIALEHGQTLVTRNRKHFDRIPGLKIKTW